MFRLFSRTTDTQGLCSSRLFNNESFYKSFTSDLRYAKQRVYIESPFITKRRIDELLPVFEGLRRRGIAVTINTRCPDEHDGEYVRQASDGIQAMQELGITAKIGRFLFSASARRMLEQPKSTISLEDVLASKKDIDL